MLNPLQHAQMPNQKARKVLLELKQAANRVVFEFVNLVEQESIDYYVAKTLRQSLKTEIKDAVEYADKLAKLCNVLNRKLNENATNEP